MVDRDVDSLNKNRSLSADADLRSAYESFRQGDYKISLGIVEKKLHKLNSPIDKFNFNVLLSLIYSKIHRLEESNNLINSLKIEMVKNDYIKLFPEMCEYFKTVLRELDKDKILKEIFDLSIKSLNLSKIDKSQQKKILKELTLNIELNELYAKVNIFLKNENEPDFELLNLIKYEVVYILCFKLQKLSKFIGSSIFKEMNTKYDALKSQKGFLDIMVKFLIGLNDTENFLKIFEGKTHEFTNAPIEDLLINIYFNQKGQEDILVNYLLNSIKNNLDKCNFKNYSRFLCYTFNHLEQTIKNGSTEMDYRFFFEKNIDYDLKFDKEAFENFSFSISKNIKENYLGVYSFFSYIKNNNEMKTKNFNTYKSSLLALIMYLHFAKISLVNSTEENFANLNEKIENYIFELIVELLECSIVKQSILMELSKYFIYLDEDKRKIILDKFSYDKNIIFSNLSELKNEDIEKIIYYEKLRKILSLDISKNDKTTLDKLNDLIEYITEITNLYFSITKNSKKLEKGERILGDDLVILINESFFEFINKNSIINFTENFDINEKFSNLFYKVYSVDLISYERSPFNYDISLFYLRLCGYMGLTTKLLNILTTMNLKGPQFESVSYIAYKYFFNTQFKQGLSYLYGNLEKWQKENKKCGRKTLWKMFTGRNFWNTEELIEFLNENENSYYKLVHEFTDLSIFYINPAISNEVKTLKKIDLFNYCESLKRYQDILENKLSNKTLIRNQDVVINIFKFKYVNYLGNNLEKLRINKNSAEKNFIFNYAIDSVYKNNIIFEKTPGFKNNFFFQDEVSVFGNYESENFLNLSFLTNILKVNLKFYHNPDKKEKVELDENYIKEILKKAEILITPEMEKKMSGAYHISKEEFEYAFKFEKLFVQFYKFEIENGSNPELFESKLDELSQILNEIIESSVKSSELANFKNNYKSYNHISKIDLVNKFRLFAKMYLPSFVLLSSKISNFVNINKNSFKNGGAIKNVINNNFKSHILNFFINLESLNNDSEELGKIEGFLNCKDFTDFNNLPSKTKVQMRKNIEETTREIKEISKHFTALIRELI